MVRAGSEICDYCYRDLKFEMGYWSGGRVACAECAYNLRVCSFCHNTYRIRDVNPLSGIGSFPKDTCVSCYWVISTYSLVRFTEELGGELLTDYIQHPFIEPIEVEARTRLEEAAAEYYLPRMWKTYCEDPRLW